VRFILGGHQTDGRFALVEHPLAPWALAAPMHTHTHEDEFSFVLEGRVGLQVGERVVIAEPGTFVHKPRRVPHTFWNAGPEPARLLELISPAGFERYFQELAPLIEPADPPDLEALAALWTRYGLNVDMQSLPRLAQAHGVTVAGPSPGHPPAVQ
jgi:mannose-6-phosphate isomerase-like protein (cupin superfamily)